MDLIESVMRYAQEHPERPCFQWREHTLTYGELEAESRRLAGHLNALLSGDTSPMVVFGHKHPLMVVSFLAAVRSGRPYIPVDSSFPVDRINSILRESGAAAVIAAGEDIPAGVVGQHVDLERVMSWVATEPPLTLDRASEVPLDSAVYIIFTSGSTGRPKGVQISRASLNCFTAWGLNLVSSTLDECRDTSAVFLNQAPFSFDLSVMDMAIALASGSTIVSVDRDHIARLSDLFHELEDRNVTVWVSTPSFADLCLSDPRFCGDRMPSVRQFLFCGETLAFSTASALHARFPAARVVNTYGPTESTVAVTSVTIDDALLRVEGSLPVGVAKPGSHILIWDDADQEVAEGQRGEIVIAGDTVSLGYLGRPDLNSKALER